jgi:hypothetical protein
MEDTKSQLFIQHPIVIWFTPLVANFLMDQKAQDQRRWIENDSH